MARRIYKPEEIIAKLRQVGVLTSLSALYLCAYLSVGLVAQGLGLIRLLGRATRLQY
jgi:hypothetical protein